MNKIAGILLAAGEGRRFRAEQPETASKLVASWRAAPLVAHVADAALSAGLPLIVVTGYAREAVEKALAGRPLQLVHNPDFAAGMAGSLRLAVAALPPETRGALVLLGDMPQVSADLIRALVNAFCAAPASTLALVPVKAGRRGNPVLLARGLFGEVLRLTGDQGARKLLTDHAARVIEMASDDPAIFADVDTPAALRQLPQK